MSADFTVDLTEFRASFNRIIREHKKDVAPYLNKKAHGVIVGTKGYKGAVQLTPEASAAKINAVTVRQLTGYVCRKARMAGEWPLSREEIKLRVEKERRRRRSAIAYTRGPGWLKAAKDLGGGTGKFGGKTSPHPEFSKSKAAKGYGRKASVSNLTALLVNKAPAADLIGRGALQEAINNQARDMVEYADREIFKKFIAESAK